LLSGFGNIIVSFELQLGLVCVLNGLVFLEFGFGWLKRKVLTSEKKPLSIQS